jgi:hypothetical protein
MDILCIRAYMHTYIHVHTRAVVASKALYSVVAGKSNRVVAGKRTGKSNRHFSSEESENTWYTQSGNARLRRISLIHVHRVMLSKYSTRCSFSPS